MKDLTQAPWISELRQRIDRYIPLLLWTVVIVTLICIPLKIISLGFLPPDDALRHAAQAVSGKAYTEVLVLRPEYTMSHNPGWDWLLRQVHQATGWQPDALVSFSIVALMLAALCAPLPWLRRPEAWIATLLAATVANNSIHRFLLGRPLVITQAILIAILFAWNRNRSFTWPKALGITLGIALSVWMHGTWYLWALLPMAFFAAREWRSGFWLTACWLAGTLGGALVTGHPFVYLKQALWIVATVQHQNVPQWMLVTEFFSSPGEFSALVLLAGLWLWRKSQKLETPTGLFSGPIFWLMTISWVLGFVTWRFWLDWGVPAFLVLVTLQCEELLASALKADTLKRLAFCAFAALALFLAGTSDLGGRYSRNLYSYSLDEKDPQLQGWFPEKDGIFYSAEMDLFYQTYFHNPHAPWRYILGFEPALMPKEDLEILRKIEWNSFTSESFKPWVAKMRPSDRLAIYTTSEPKLPELEWTNAVRNVWVGRLRSNPQPTAK